MSDALVGALIGGGFALFGSVLVQGIIAWREDRLRKLDHDRTVRGIPLDTLLSVVSSVTSVATEHKMFHAISVADEATDPRQASLFNAAVKAITDIQRARVAMFAISGPSEVSVALSELVELLNSVVAATETEQVVEAIEGIMAVLGRIEKQYMDLKTTWASGT